LSRIKKGARQVNRGLFVNYNSHLLISLTNDNTFRFYQ
jgi:hypothetical protein